MNDLVSQAKASRLPRATLAGLFLLRDSAYLGLGSKEAGNTGENPQRPSDPPGEHKPDSQNLTFLLTKPDFVETTLLSPSNP